MIISNAQVQLQSQHQSLSSRHESLEFEFRLSNNQPDLQISPRSIQSEPAQQAQQVESLRKNLEFEVSLLKLLIERLTGRKISFYIPETTAETQPDIQLDNTAPASSSPDFSMSLDYSSSTYESEKLQFSTSAIVNTSDGRQIEVDLNISYQRELETQQNFSLRAGQALKDPLVLNFSGNALQLASTTFDFDLDMDGSLDQIPLFQSDSAFLALDKNQDGVINDGSELFGAKSGDGFNELRHYDSDGNHWIDENDPVFAQLRLFRPGSDGQTQLISLNDKGVGALYLGNISTPFELHDKDNLSLNGALKSSGIYLTESGQAGSLQQIDLAV
jgi:hypothetical protein